MAIQVTCPGCLKRFNVSDKFAGKTGPCPSCQKTIKIPEKSDEVVIHAPEDKGPKDSKGRSVLKPIRRSEVKLSPVTIGIVAVSCVAVLAIAIGLGLSGGSPPTALLAVASIALAIPLVFVGYWFLRDDELDAYVGKPLYGRLAICATIFAATWAIYAWAPTYLLGLDSMAQIDGLTLAVMIPILLVIGTVASVLVFELEIGTGVAHYAFYFVITFALAWMAGTPLAAPLSGDSAPAQPQQTAPGTSAPQPGPAPSSDGTETKIPNLLQ
ncbi:MAG: hypothetical protein Aurels2KO_05340 [Aureliella sp.]